MASVFPFNAVQYSKAAGDPGTLIAPPYDVLDRAAKERLLGRSARNIVAVDLPHIPAKELGPPEAYEGAGRRFREWLADGTMVRRERASVFVYRQTFAGGGPDAGPTQRTGMACTIETLPFGAREGGGVLPHEETFSGPKEDRLALMRATRAQLSPIFGLHQDERGEAAAVVWRVAASRGPDVAATTDDGVRHEVWAVEDEATIGAYQRALTGQDVFVADGHHRYNTALNYLKELEGSEGRIGPEHPARRCMVVLVGMSDPGLAIWPTHRVLGGMSGYSMERFLAASGGELRTEPVDAGLAALERALHERDDLGESRFGLYDFATGASRLAAPTRPDPLASRFGSKPRAWRSLPVALVQHLVVEEICQPRLNGGNPVAWAFPHTIAEVEAIGRGSEMGSGGGKGFQPQLAVILRPTPLEAVREISRAGELMPQKSTFFYPKLATGLFVNPVG